MMKTNYLFATFLSLSSLCSFTGFSQNIIQRGPYNPGVPMITQVSVEDSLYVMREHVVLQLANEKINNDHLFFKAYLLTGPQQNRYSNSRVLHIELQDTDGTTVKKQFHEIIDGMVTGNIILPKRTKEGNYIVKAYTQWMKNYNDNSSAKKQIQIGDTFNTGTVATNTITMLPEGGVFLQGFKNKIVFQIPSGLVSTDGSIGTIVDSQDNSIIKVQEYNAGSGIAFLEPKSNERYFLKLENGTTYPLPDSESQGHLLQVNNIAADVANIQVVRSEKAQKTTLTLIGTLRGVPYFEKKISFTKNKADIKLDKEKIPRGILELQLIDQEGNQLAKRPIWIDGQSLQITLDQVALSDTEATYKVKVTDQKNKPVQTEVALSIISEATHTTGFKDADVFASLPNEQENTTERNSRFLQDMYVLIAQKYNIGSPSETTVTSKNIQYPIQKGLHIKGYAYDLNNKLLVNTPIQVMFTNENGISIKETTTNADGMLRIDNIQIDGETTLLCRTQGDDTKSRLVQLERMEDSFYVNPKKEKERIKEAKKSTKNENNTPKDEKALTVKPFDTTGTLVLNEVPLTGRKTKEAPKNETPSVYGVKPSKHQIVYQDYDRPKELARLLTQVPGVIISGLGEISPSISIPRASGSVLFVVDGIPLSKSSAPPPPPGSPPTSGNTLISALNGPARTSLSQVMNIVSFTDIQRIEVLIGPEAAIFGSRGAGGVVAIYTRFAEDTYIPRKKAQLDFQGYETAITFEEYQQNLSKKERKNATVLYWNPAIETNEDGEATITLPITDTTTPLKVKATTINQKGNVGILQTSLN
ncbi:TonB-dependent receptor plug domain-containing protein [uncultured Dokdonia sp.]|uniref:TonB-dependent receptor n=1 Tax=uncultured Dokdonia sp. TaxID=575653 RepID=UPI0026122AAC|nr:TonB-dependent receptor plug domain-containing protein [uncultured Dokdonia sp.]